MSPGEPKRKPSASPICYADETDIAPGYMWAEHPPRPEKKKTRAQPKARRTTTKKSAKR